MQILIGVKSGTERSVFRGTLLQDVRYGLRMLVKKTDDAQKIYMACRGIAYTPTGGTLFARILPMFETGAAKYLWLNNIVAVGVYRPMPEKVAYRIFRIL